MKMKNRIVCILILFSCLTVFSQGHGKTKIKTESGGIEIYLKNGTIEKGNLLKLKHPFLKLLDSRSVEDHLGLNAENITIKNENGEKKVIPAEDIASIRVKEKDSTYSNFYYMPLKTVDKNFEVVDVEKKALLPMVYDDRVNVFMYNVYSDEVGKANAHYMGSVVYLSKDGEGYAMKMGDMKGVSVFNMKKAKKRMTMAIKEIFKDCPATIEYIEEMEGQDQKEFRQAFYSKFQEAQSASSKLSKEDGTLYMDEFYSNIVLAEYIKMIDNYNMNCP
ncbi:hypothetical protein [Ulvibacter antarcticus]|uniref:Uncharacterized protein n=1 Tax=Ulvibacter antarcticus TaxID=442714 RepID=A0A3L9Z1C7_9FLAO|nr:hypothetical protein [Ulvibacter antarcticus]RMA65920.1 hypothetical protein BXY75_0336 [Ulvibacter antarcticus]